MFTNCWAQGAIILPGWELVWLGFDGHELFPDLQVRPPFKMYLLIGIVPPSIS